MSGEQYESWMTSCDDENRGKAGRIREKYKLNKKEYIATCAIVHCDEDDETSSCKVLKKTNGF